MKRLRDERYSSFKRPSGTTRGEFYGQTPNIGTVGGSGEQKLTTNDALHYLKEVKEMFQNRREKYDQFLEVMKDFKAQRIDTEGVIVRIKELFRGHNNLIIGFNTFLPKGYEITLDEECAPPKKVVEFEEAIDFVNKIKKRFQSDDRVYKSFLEILNMYRKEHKSITEVYEEVSRLFRDHPDLLDEFERFLPDNSASGYVHTVQHGRVILRQYDERTPAMPSRQLHIDKQRRQTDNVGTSYAEHELRLECPDPDDDKTMIRMHKDQKKREKESRREKEIRDRRNWDANDKKLKHDGNRDLDKQHFTDKRKEVRKEGFGLEDEKNSMKSMYNQELTFCERVKEKLGSSDDYQAFLKCLHIYSTEIINRSELQSLVADILGKYPDLMEGFNEFLSHCENIDGFLAGAVNQKSLWSDGHLPRSMKTEDKGKEPKCDAEEAKERERGKEKYWAKSIQDLDLSDCQCCTPSYRLLPDDYPIPTASQRTEIGAEVLNDLWVSVTSGSEDYSFKHMRRNQYEESLFRCEDDRFELDMLLEAVNSTKKNAEDLLKSINDKTTNIDPPIHLEDHFTALNLRCIERIYSDHGLDVLDILRKNPAMALPVVLTRLNQKQDEWMRCRSDFNKLWAEIYAKNHYKSLDHRSFYFKQQDSKYLSNKSLVAEIKETKEKLQKEDDVFLAVAVCDKRPMAAHCEFEYSDTDVHEDIHRLIEYSCEEVCSTKEQFTKVMRLWSTFIEPMLSVSCKILPPDEPEDACRVHNRSTRTLGASALEVDGSLLSDSTHNKISRRGDEIMLNEASGVSVSRNLGFIRRETTCRDNALTIAQSDARLKSIGSVENVAERLVISNASSLFGAESSGGASIKQLASDVQIQLRPNCESHVDSDAAQCKEDAGILYPVPVTYRSIQDGCGILEPCNVSVGCPKNEKEEGELSPNCDFVEENCVANRDKCIQTEPEGRDYGNHENTVPDNETDVDDEDSENGSEAGNDAGGSESAGDECSREEREDEDDGERDELDGKVESESETDAHSNGVDEAPVSQRFFVGLKPLRNYVWPVTQDDERKCSHLFYGNDNFYVLFRLHQILYERILTAKKNCKSSEAMWNLSKDLSSSDPYESFMSALFSLLDGTSDNAKFEDDCRAIIGNQAYVLFTLDKVIYKLLKQLQTIATDEADNQLLQLYEYEKSRNRGRFIDSVYYQNARVVLNDENIYRFEFASLPSRCSIQLMDKLYQRHDVVAVSMDPNFSAYLHSEHLSDVPSEKDPRGVFLERNKHKYAGMDESSAMSSCMEDVRYYNALDCKVACRTSKMLYVLATEDFFYRPVKRRKNTPADITSKLNQARVRRFHKFLSSAQ